MLRAISLERPPHALLLIGPDGVGKTTLALDLAAGLLCQEPDPARRPCRACSSCRRVEHGQHPDLHRVAPEGAGEQIRLAQVQQLAAELALLPMEGRLRVAVITDAHRMNPDAQNALLKVLEEPVGAACIVLVADDAATLLPTVLSRTARLRCGPVATSVIADLLVEQGVADPPRARVLAASSGGMPGIAERTCASDAALLRPQLDRRLLDLLGADRRARFAAASDLMAAGAALDAFLSTGRAGAGTDADTVPTEASNGEDPEADRPSPGATAGAGRKRSPRSGSAGSAGSGTKRPQPAERRRAVLRLLGSWRQLGRDLAVASAGGRAEIHALDLLEELQDAGRSIDRAELICFLERLDALAAAIEAYANPELVLDVLLLAWPRRAA